MMVKFCVIINCSNRSKRVKNKSFYRIPAVIVHSDNKTKDLSQKRRDKWLSRIGRADLNSAKCNNARVCSDHFVTGKPSALYDTKSRDWAPSRKLGYDSGEKSVEEGYDRPAQRRGRTVEEPLALAEPLAAELEIIRHEQRVVEEPSHPYVEAFVSTISTDHTTTLEVDTATLRGENSGLEEQMEASSLDKHDFESNDEMVLFYTGLPTWEVLLCLYNFVLPHLSHSPRCALNPFQQLLLTLIRLRLGLGGKDLSLRFGGIHESTVSRVFVQVLNVLYRRLKPVIIWPNRDMLRKTLPINFRKHCPSCVVIIDCFEISLDRSLNPRARTQSNCSSKHQGTVGYVIGLTPQGTVGFISVGQRGLSDKLQAENSGILDNLIPGDVILAGGGYDNKDSVGLYCARFKEGNQLSDVEVDETQRVKNVRIHVEQVIGSVRKRYSILSSTLPLDWASTKGTDRTTLDKIVTVTCALTNLCDSVVPVD